ncbi:MAG: DUF2800 domain-containing protein [Pyrinomonadaceae bacterium]
MPGQHARLSPSSSKGWLACAGRITMEASFPDAPNEHSDRGTACHDIAARVLTGEGVEVADYLDDPILVSDEGEEKRFVEFDEDLVAMTEGYVAEIRALRETSEECWIEQRVEFSDWVDVPEQFGTADVIMLRKLAESDAYELAICDLKTGYHWVDAEENSQLMLYALGAYRRFDLSHDITSIRLMIYQPRHGGMREWTCTLEHLLEFAEKAKAAAQRVEEAAQMYTQETSLDDEEPGGWNEIYLHPSPNEQDCAYCRAMSTCPAMRKKMESMMACTFDEVPEKNALITTDIVLMEPDALAKAMAAVGLMEDFCKATRAETERRLLLSIPVEGFGLELGRQGPRGWNDPAAAEEYMKKSLRLSKAEMYSSKLVSPTQAERLAGLKDGKKIAKPKVEPILSGGQWAKLQKLVKRSDAKPSVKPLAAIKTLYNPSKPDASVFDEVSES